MRITIDIPDAIYRRLKSRAARERTCAKKLILRGIERVLLRQTIKLPIVRSKRPGTLLLDNARIYEVISFP